MVNLRVGYIFILTGIPLESNEESVHMDFSDPKFWDQWLQKKDNYQNIREVLIHLAVCHTVI